MLFQSRPAGHTGCLCWGWFWLQALMFDTPVLDISVTSYTCLIRLGVGEFTGWVNNLNPLFVFLRQFFLGDVVCWGDHYHWLVHLINTDLQHCLGRCCVSKNHVRNINLLSEYCIVKKKNKTIVCLWVRFPHPCNVGDRNFVFVAHSTEKWSLKKCNSTTNSIQENVHITQSNVYTGLN